MWNLYEEEKELKPLVFSNGKSQADIVKEVLDAINEGSKIIFIKGMCGTGKSAIALNLARKLGRASIVVPIKSLQEQYSNDYSGKKYLLHNGKKLKISPIFGRSNFRCRYLDEFSLMENKYLKEKDSKLSDIFAGKNISKQEREDSCDNSQIPCKIEIKDKNLNRLKDYLRQNNNNLSDFSETKDIKRLNIAPLCPYWSPLWSDELDLKKLKDSRKITYQGLEGKKFTIYQRKPGCPYYDQYLAYAESDILIFNSLKYKIESAMNRKPKTDVEIIDECDDFLDSFANQEQINLNRLSFTLSSFFPEDLNSKKVIDELIETTNKLKNSKLVKEPSKEIYSLKSSLVHNMLNTVLKNQFIFDSIEDSSYLYHLLEVAKVFYHFIDETYFSIDKRENEINICLVTTNLADRLKELVEKNKVLVMMSGTLHAESVLRNIFGIDKFKVVEAETKVQGELIKCKHGYEIDCNYNNFQSNRVSREIYLNALSKSISCAKRPTLVHVNSFSDLPTKKEKMDFSLDLIPTQEDLIQEQANDPLGKKIEDFKEGKIKILFTTKCNRGIDFPGEICNSIVITKFPYPNISDIFWKILKKTKPNYFMSFYLDRARRELLQKVYRGLRSERDKVYLLSPDIRVLNFNFN